MEAQTGARDGIGGPSPVGSRSFTFRTVTYRAALGD